MRDCSCVNIKPNSFSKTNSLNGLFALTSLITNVISLLLRESQSICPIWFSVSTSKLSYRRGVFGDLTVPEYTPEIT